MVKICLFFSDKDGLKTELLEAHSKYQKTNYTWIKLLHKDDFDNIEDLTNITILNVC